MLILIKQNMNKIQIIIVLIYKITKDETTINNKTFKKNECKHVTEYLYLYYCV